MEFNGPTKRLQRTVAFGAVVLSAMMLVSVLVPQPAAEASAFSDSPCPRYSIHDVFADPDGNWDGDQVNNSDELYNELNPCVVDSSTFCAGGNNSLCTYLTYLVVDNSSKCYQSINAFPSGDYDRDGVTNSAEVRAGANPCAHPCPNPTNADLSLNPHGSWDNDGISNAVEVSRGTNPCSSVTYNPCPNYTLAQVNGLPGFDWDGDGVTNANEVRRGTNPCVVNTVQIRLPHVVTTPRQLYVYVAPTPAPVAVLPTCPQGYPYYHAANGLCYANPISQVVRY